MRGWKIFFALAALNNLTVGAGLMFGADYFAAVLGVTGSGASYITGFAGLAILLFGVSYVLVALDPLGNRPLVVIGALGKAAAVTFTSWHASQGHVPNDIYLAMMTDLVWALIFAVFLQRTRKRVSAPSPSTGSA